ncbi:uncharacterized protein LOC118095406 [Zootoca vivipara]|uniref:uncharacterized protein LOC118095406 n=1 Tax=Zootoca vivipara TaxID=8524 RepID=UPI00293BA2A2|nr:uncharacterized protein LOC118095406 [Zootoca vivipara]
MCRAQPASEARLTGGGGLPGYGRKYGIAASGRRPSGGAPTSAYTVFKICFARTCREFCPQAVPPPPPPGRKKGPFHLQISLSMAHRSPASPSSKPRTAPFPARLIPGSPYSVLVLQEGFSEELCDGSTRADGTGVPGAVSGCWRGWPSRACPLETSATWSAPTATLTTWATSTSSPRPCWSWARTSAGLMDVTSPRICAGGSPTHSTWGTWMCCPPRATRGTTSACWSTALPWGTSWWPETFLSMRETMESGSRLARTLRGRQRAGPVPWAWRMSLCQGMGGPSKSSGKELGLEGRVWVDSTAPAKSCGALRPQTQMVTKRMKDLETKPCEERLREVGVLSLEKRRPRGDRRGNFKYLKGCPMEDGTSFFSAAPEGRAQANGFKLQERRFRLNIRKNFLTVMVPAVHIQATGRKGCCGNRCGMFLSIIFAAVGALGAVYAVATSSLGLVHGPLCQYQLTNGTLGWGRPFESSVEDFSEKNYLFDTSLWDVCLDPPGVTRFNVILFSLILASGLVEFCLCVLQVLNGLFGCVCGTCNEEEKETYH